MSDADVVLLVEAHRAEVAAAEFDEATHTWTLGDQRARVVIATDGALPAEFFRRTGDLVPYLGVAVHGVPNYFIVTGPDVAAQKCYIARCLEHMAHTGSTRIEVRPGTARVFTERNRGRTHRSGRYWRRVARRIPSAFEVRSLAEDIEADDEIYTGPATVQIGTETHRAQVRLTGRLDPNDGRYHWQGMVFDDGWEVRLPQEVTVTVAGRPAAARLTERTPWSAFSVVGVGAPPYATANPTRED